MRQLKSLAESKLFQRITDSALKAIVERTARESAALLGTVVSDMPLFTLHDERHILNVIGWMETLLKLSAEQIEHARKLIREGESHIAELLNGRPPVDAPSNRVRDTMDSVPARGF